MCTSAEGGHGLRNIGKKLLTLPLCDESVHHQVKALVQHLKLPFSDELHQFLQTMNMMEHTQEPLLPSELHL